MAIGIEHFAFTRAQLSTEDRIAVSVIPQWATKTSIPPLDCNKASCKAHFISYYIGPQSGLGALKQRRNRWPLKWVSPVYASADRDLVCGWHIDECQRVSLPFQ